MQEANPDSNIMFKAFILRFTTAINSVSMQLILVLLLTILFFNKLQEPLVNCLLLQDQSATLQETKCLNCIRNITSANVDLTKRCDGYYCGPFQLNYQYWAEAGKPGNGQGSRDFEKCARDRNCSEQTVRAYFKKFRRDCNNDGLIDCLDMAALHKGGPASCSSDWFYKSRFWVAFNKTTCATMINETGDLDGGGGGGGGGDSGSTGSSSGVNLNTRNHHQPIRVMKNQSLTNECLDCICEAVSGCNTSANNCGSGTVCGPFAISQAYWKDGRRPGASWTGCARTKECSSVTIKNYMEKYKRDCTGDGYVTCEDYAAIHRRGPRACTNSDLFKEQYWIKFLACRANQKPVNDANMVRVDEDKSSDLAANSNLASRGELSPITSTSSAGLIISGSNNNQPSTTVSTPTSTSASTVAQSQTTLAPSTAASSTTKTKLGITLETMMSPYQTNQINYRPNQQVINQQVATTLSNPISSNRIFEAHQESPKHELKSIINESLIDLNQAKQSTSRSSISSPATSASITTTSTESPPAFVRYDQYLTQNRRTQHRFPSPYPSSPVYLVNQASNAETSRINPINTNWNSRRTTADVSEQTQSTTSSFSYDQESSTTAHKRPIIDYSSLPTIIVSRPLGPIGSGTRLSANIHQPAYILSSLSSTSSATTSIPATIKLITLQQSPLASTASQQTTYYYSTESPTTQAMPAIKQQHKLNQGEMSDETQMPETQDGYFKQDSNQPSTSVTPDVFTSSIGSSLASTSSESEIVDYTIPEYQDNTNDRTNFDKVVNGIVGNPEFSKSYPPVPEVILQHQPQSVDISDSSGPNKNKIGSSVKNLQHKSINRNAPSSRNHYLQTNVNKTPLTATTRSNPIRYELDLIVNHSPGELTNNGESSSTSLSSISGTKYINMTNLYEKELNETSRIANECLECICDASSNCDTTVQCISKQREKNRCGLYMISWNQYQESDISLLTSLSIAPGISKEEVDEKMYYECTTDRNCAEKLIQLYIEKHQKDCNEDGKIDCYDIAAIHRVGPDNCNSGKFLGSQYWKDFNICYATDSSTNPNQPSQPTSGG